MTREVKERQNIILEIEDLFLRLTEILWAHVSRCSSGDNKNISLNITEHFIIEYLGKESFASMSRLSKIIHVSPTTMTSIVDRLIRRGFLQRYRAQQDRRKVLVTLSDEGKNFYLRHHFHFTELYIHFLSSLPDHGKAFAQNLQEIKENITQLKNHLEGS